MAGYRLKTGDIVLTHGNYFSSKLIRFGQTLRFRGKRRKYAYWNHAALVLDSDGNIAEALSNGVVRSHISKYENTVYAIISVDASMTDQTQILEFAESVLKRRERYGWLTILALFFTLTVGSKIVIGKIGTAICSGFASEALTRKGEVFPKPPSYMTPADLAEHFNVEWQHYN